MWTVVYISPNGVIAEQIKAILVNEGLLVMLRPMGVPHLGELGSVEVLVPESEAEEASQILTENLPV
ncbi:MAG: DUF2007 domain-containing protein [Clostridia bacterium]|nr:DUF2007 domain-containing protein [Clostridia bacterium]MDD4049206.1 DUF2007 domain-containing protein [Clostridia bacterium]